MLNLNRRSAVLAGFAGVAALPCAAATGQPYRGAGVVVLRSARPFRETIVLLKQDIAAKRIVMFAEIDQADLAAKAGIKLLPSTLLIFGNPPLGIQFLTANP